MQPCPRCGTDTYVVRRADGSLECESHGPLTEDDPLVVVSLGGATYHTSRRCRAMLMGKAKVMEEAPVESWRRSRAESRGYQPCRRCFSDTGQDAPANRSAGRQGE